MVERQAWYLALGYFIAGLALAPSTILSATLYCRLRGLELCFVDGFTVAASVGIYILLAIIHELIHYLAARLLGVKAAIKTLLRYGALSVVILEPIAWRRYVVLALTPLAALQPLLYGLGLVFDYWIGLTLYLVAGMHLAASIPDVISAAYVAARGLTLEPIVVSGRVIAWREYSGRGVVVRSISKPYMYLGLLLAGIIASGILLLALEGIVVVVGRAS